MSPAITWMWSGRWILISLKGDVTSDAKIRFASGIATHGCTLREGHDLLGKGRFL